MKPLICFIGLDGSGKSTSIEHVYTELRKQGVNVEVVRAAYVVKVMSLFVKIGKKILLKKSCDPYASDYKSYLEKLRNKGQNEIVYNIFTLLTTVEFKMQIIFNIIIKRWMGKTLLVDRYIYDNAVTYAANLGKDEKYIRKTIEGRWKYTPKPDLIVYIKTPVDVCFMRKDDIPDPLYLKIREPLYNAVASMYNVKVISGAQEKDAMLNEVMQAVSFCLGSRSAV